MFMFTHVPLKGILIETESHCILHILMNAPKMESAALKALWLLLSILNQILIPATFLLLTETAISLQKSLTKEALLNG